MPRDTSLPLRAHRFVADVAERLSWLPLTLTRVALGVVFVQSGWGKLHDLPNVVEFFRGLGVPAPELQAPFVAGLELVGGGLLLAGLFTRVVSVPLAVAMVVAIATARRADVASLSDLFGLPELLYVLLFGTLAAFGAGPLSLDRLLVRLTVGREPEEGAAALPALGVR